MTPMPHDTLPAANLFPNTNWKFLLEKIEQQRCVLFLGPQALPASINEALDERQRNDPATLARLDRYFPDGIRTVEQALQARLLLQEPTRSYIRKFYPDLGFFLFEQEHLEAKLITEMRAFFQNTEFSAAGQMLQKLAEVPFHLIVTLTPDPLLHKAFEEKRLPLHPHHYYKRQKTQPIETPTKERPVVYQLLGSIEEDESLLLTHNGLFDYFNAIFHEYQLPHNLIEKLKDAQSFVFLGLPFEKWYMQLLLRLFSIHLPQHKFNHLAVKKFASDDARDLWKDQFRMEFEEADTAAAFVEELHRHCDARRILRKPAQSIAPTNWKEETDKVKYLVGAGEIIPALDFLQALAQRLFPKTKELLDDLVLVRGKHKRLERDIILGIAEGDVQQKQQRIAHAILHLTNEFLNLATA